MRRLARPVFIRGNEYRGIFIDDEFEDEVGTRRELSLTVERAVAEIINKGDEVIIPGESYYVDGMANPLDVPHRLYKVKHIPDLDLPLIPVELQRA